MSEATDILTEKYRAMYRAMITKDTTALDRLLADCFVLIHMTGMRQDKQQFLHYLLSGTLNYYSEELHETTAQINGNTATLVGKSYVAAAVFGGGKHTWRLQLDLSFEMQNGEWLITKAVASTW